MKFFIEVKKTKQKGRGVFALKNFKKNETVEKCPVIILTGREDIEIQKTILGRYVYEWNPDDSAVILGYGFIYNHSYTPNTFYKRDFKNNLMIYKALKNISKGEEITINYNGNPNDLNPVDDFIPI